MNVIDNKNWRLGVDAGNRSIGMSAVEYDETNTPIRILAAVSFIHDGGIDDEKIPDSRKAKAGVARRVRRMRKRRVGRLNALRRFLTENGIPSEIESLPQTDLAWIARSRLAKEFVEDQDERVKLMGRAILHIAHFRGWRNPWKGIDSLKELRQPSQSLTEMLEFAERKFDFNDANRLRTVGDLGALSVGTSEVRVRPRNTVEHTTKKVKVKELPLDTPVLFNQIKQEDILYELRLILDTQKVDKVLADAIVEKVFTQAKPYVRAESVGKDPFDKSPRAPRASLEFQEFRIRDKVANLRRITNGHKGLLSPEIANAMVDYLLEYKGSGPVYWTALGELFLIPEEELHVEKSVDGSSLRAPLNESMRVMHNQKLSKKVFQWWEGASFDDRSQLIMYLADPVESELPLEVEKFLNDLDDNELADVLSLTFISGRSPYGITTLRKLNEVMRDNNCDLYTARSIAFNTEADWQLPLPAFDLNTGQPAVDRNLAIMRRFLMVATQKWGAPRIIVIEHQRDGFVSPKSAKGIEYEQRRTRKLNDEAHKELIGCGVESPRKYDIRKMRLLQVQNTTCLYCGNSISMETCELDHIVPRADGGSNRVSNLAAVCRRCNAAKGRMTFYHFATSGNVPEVTLEGAKTRVERWLPSEDRFDKKAFEAYKADVIRRLFRKSFDEAIDERSFVSTAYASVEIRDRVEAFLISQCGVDAKDAHKRVMVFNGRVTSLARKASRFESNVNLRDQKVNKTRFDRRHHALDATIVSTLSPMVAQALVVLDEKRQAQKREELEGWQSERSDVMLGADLQAVYRRWISRAQELTKIIGDALNADRVVVMNPHRLGVSVGQLHKDTVLKLHRRPFGSAMTTDEIKRVVHREIYTALREIENRVAKKGGGVEADETRELYLKGKGILKADDAVEFFPLKSTAGCLRTSNGCVEMGSFHHSRVYAWKDAKGKIQFGQIRVYAGEMAKIGLTKKVDLFTHPLPLWSESFRLSDDKVQNAIQRGQAVQIGWLAVGDEFDFGTPQDVPGSGVKDFLTLYPETKWSLEGMDAPSRLTLRPLYLSEEGLDDNSEVCVKKIVKRPGWLLTINVALNSQNLTIIRRTAIGAPKWKRQTGEHQPISWKPYQIAKELLG